MQAKKMRITDFFRRQDKDGDGFLSRDEFVSGMLQSGELSLIYLYSYLKWITVIVFLKSKSSIALMHCFSRRAVVSYWRKYVHEVLVNHLGGLSLPRKSVVRLTDRPDMTLDVYRGRKTTIQQQQH